MSRPRLYATNAERQAAYRQKQKRDMLDQVPVVHGEGYTLYQGDALRVQAALGPVDHVLTAPPYGSHATHATHLSTVTLRTGKTRQALGFDGLSRRQVLRLVRTWRTLARRWVVFTCERHYMQALDDAGLLVRFGLWRKPNGVPQLVGDRPGTGWEAVAICHRDGRKAWNMGGTHAVWDVPVVHGGSKHPTEKPVRLFGAFVHDFTDPGDVVLDPFMGVGTTGVACIEHGRRFIGIEQDPRYFALACDRLARTAAQGRLFAATPPPRQAALL
jgi:site-specific DNA-methyltransferase (adenine-specific)